MSQQQAMFSLIAKLSGSRNKIVVDRTLCQLMGTLEGGVFLSQLLYWSDKGRGEWFYKTYKEWTEETFLTEYQVRQCAKSCNEHGFLETQVRKANGNPTVHYRFDTEVFMDWILKNLSIETATLQYGNLNASVSIPKKLQEPYTETTTDITTYTTTDITTDIAPLPEKTLVVKPSKHPAVAAYREIVERFPNKAQMKMIAEKNPPLDNWIRAVRSWIGRGYNPGNIETMLEWAENPALMEKFSGNNAKRETIRNRTEVSDGQIEDNGGWGVEELAAIKAARDAGDRELAGRLVREGNQRWEANGGMSEVQRSVLDSWRT